MTVWVVLRAFHYKSEKSETLVEEICGFFGTEEDAEVYAAWMRSEYPAEYYVECHDISRTASDAIEHRIQRRSVMEAKAKASLENCLARPDLTDAQRESLKKALAVYQ